MLLLIGVYWDSRKKGIQKEHKTGKFEQKYQREKEKWTLESNGDHWILNIHRTGDIEDEYGQSKRNEKCGRF